MNYSLSPESLLGINDSL